MKVLVINCGSSSLKFQLIDSDTEKVVAKGLCERIGIDGSRIAYTPAGGEKEIKEIEMPTHSEAIKAVIEALTNSETGVISELSEVGAVGHRVVHGGEYFNKSVVIDENVISKIEECNDLAPLHNPANIIGIRACMEAMPGTVNVAVFDTAFHQTMPRESYLYAIPKRYYDDYKIRRYGFHGTSHSFVSKRASEILGKDYQDIKTIVCHLGNGASICAVENGKSVDTSMGLTPLAGVVMGTRSGDVDPEIVKTIAKKDGVTVDEALNVLNKQSGVFGVSQVSSDFRDIDAAIAQGNDDAVAAMEVFVHSVVKYVGAYAAAMNGVDCIAFTAGVGENNPGVRAKVCERLGFLGITIDQEANKVMGEEREISQPDSKVKVWVIPTNEELAIARETLELL
ncbi:MAG: acetate kinase [Lachnospiraceae bacterium]|nr:acetate kinase [Lachnospiraceae bacterium]